jgi:hypothetical protein
MMTLQEITNEAFQRMKERHPLLTQHLYDYIRTSPVDGGGFEVLGVRKGEIYATPEEAQDAREAAIMRVLLEVEHVYH